MQYTTEEYSCIKSSEVLIHATALMSFEIIILTVKKPFRKGHILYISTYMKFHNGKSIETKGRLVVVRAWVEMRMGDY